MSIYIKTSCLDKGLKQLCHHWGPSSPLEKASLSGQPCNRDVAGATQPQVHQTASRQGIMADAALTQPPRSALARAADGRPPPVRAGVSPLRQAVYSNTALMLVPAAGRRREQKAQKQHSAAQAAAAAGSCRDSAAASKWSINSIN